MQERFTDKVLRRLSRALVTERVPLRLDRPIVSFTFDDIPETAALSGARILEERGVRGSFYVSGGLAGQDWYLYRLASLDQVAALDLAGHEIGCHTASHLCSTRVGMAEMLSDVDRNAALLEPIVGRLATFAYPYGSIAPRQKFALQRRFSVCRGIHGGMMAGSFDRGRLNAVPLEEVAMSEARIDALLDDLVRRKAWLAFYTHDVDMHPTRFGVTPERLAYAVDGALARGCVVETVRSALALNEAQTDPERVGA